MTLLTSAALRPKCPICGAAHSTCGGTDRKGNVVMGETAKSRVVVSYGNGVEFIVAAGDPIPDGAEIVRDEPLPSSVADVAAIPADVDVTTEQDVGVENPSFEVFGTSTRQVKPAGDGTGRMTADEPPGVGEPVSIDDEPGETGEPDEGPDYPDASATRAELDEYAVSVGIDPTGYKNKDAVADAIAAYHEEADE